MAVRASARAAARRGEEVRLEGATVRSVVFERDEYVIARARIGRETISIKGRTPVALKSGMELTCVGSWDKPYTGRDGVTTRTFAASAIIPITPKLETEQSIIDWLGSGIIPGIGERRAKALVERFGVDVLDLIRRGDQRLTEVHGISEQRVEAMREAYTAIEQAGGVCRELMARGLGMADAMRVWKAWGEEAMARVDANPYALAEIPRIGFVKADAVAAALGFGGMHPFRLKAAVVFALDQASVEGHTWQTEREVKKAVAALLRSDPDSPDTEMAIASALDSCVKDGRILAVRVGGHGGYALPGLARAEECVANRLLQAKALKAPAKGAQVRSCGVKLSASQERAVAQILGSPISILTGGPGTGKTTITRVIVDTLRARGLEVSLCSPTGKAAKRLSESCGLEAKTIHRLLEAEVDRASGRFRFRRGPDNPLHTDFVVVDEASMVDARLARSLMEALPKEAGILFVGDEDQLPSVGPGQVLADLIASGQVTVCRLTEIHRQADGSDIVRAAHALNSGRLLAPRGGLGESDWVFLRVDEEALQHAVVSLACNLVPKAYGIPPEEVQVLTLMNTGPLGTVELNRLLQERLNPDGTSFEYQGAVWREGDRVMQVRNDYENDVYNGDQGRIVGVDRSSRTLLVAFESGAKVRYTADKLEELRHAWCITVHKSQGSEFRAVVMPVSRSHTFMASRRIYYTGITRGKEQVTLVGDPQTLARAARGVGRAGVGANRRTQLEWLLRASATMTDDPRMQLSS